MAEKRPLQISEETESAIEYLVPTHGTSVRPTKKAPRAIQATPNRSRTTSDAVGQVTSTTNSSKKKEASEPRAVGISSITHLAGKYEGEEWDEILEEIKRNRQEGVENEIVE